MKLIRLFIVMISFSFNAYSQDTLISYREVVVVDSTAKADLYNRAKLWIVNSFKDSKSVIQLDNADQIISKGNFGSFYNYRIMGSDRKIFGHVDFTLSITFKDGKYKAEMYDLSFISDESSGSSFKTITSAKNCPDKWPMVSQKKMDAMWEDVKKNINTGVKSTFISLKQSMSVKKPVDDF